jgi:hypothetical protein
LSLSKSWGILSSFLLISFLSAAAETSTFSPTSVKYNLKIKVEVPAGEGNLWLWVPFPSANAHQKILNVTIDSPYPWQITKENHYGNKMLFVKGEAKEVAWFVTTDIDVERHIDNGVPPQKINGDNVLNPKNYFGPTSWISFNDEIVRIAQKETKNLKTPFEKIEAL